MNQFIIKGIDYPDDSLEHGLGKGSGRGRPVGSKNGQVMPGAAYMKDYKIVGQKAVGDSELPGASRNNPYARAATNQSVRNSPAARSNTGRPNAPAVRQTAARQPARTAPAASTPAANVAKGKQAITNMMEKGSSSSSAPQKQNNIPTIQGSMGEFWNQGKGSGTASKSNDYSEKHIREVGGLASPEGRQIVYSNPSLSDDYKKQVAKKYGDSDGKSYPKSIKVLDDADPHQGAFEGEFRQPGQAEQNQNPAGPGYTFAAGQPVTAEQARAAYEQSRQPQPAPAAAPQAQQPQQQPQAAPQQEQKAPETPEQKSLWDNIGGWFSQAGKDIGDTVVGAWNATGKAMSDAANWVGERLGGAGDWAQTAYNDVSKWVGDRAGEFNDWWNGKDVEVLDNGRWRQGHQNGVRENIDNALGAAGKWLGDRGQEVSNFINGVKPGSEQAAPYYDANLGRWVDPTMPSLGERIGGAANAAGQWIGNAANDVGQWVGNTANAAGQSLNDWWNGTDNKALGFIPTGHTPGARENIANAFNNAGQTISDWWNGTDNKALGFIPTGHTPGARENIGNFFNNAGQTISDAAGNAGQAINNWWNGTDSNFLGIPTGHTPGARENIGNALNNAGQAVSDAWNTVTGQRQEENPLLKFANTSLIGPNALNGGPFINPEYGQNFNNATQYLGNLITGRPQQGNWFNDNIVAPVTNAANGVGDFVRNTGNDLNNWWNGTDNKALGFIPTGHTPGARENIGNWLNNAGQTISDATGNVGQAVNNWWNGTDNKALGFIPTGHTPGARENIGNWLNNAGQTISDAAGNVGQAIGNAANSAGQWIGNAANDVGAAVGDTAGVTGLNARAVAAGVPLGTIGHWNQQFANGEITPSQYEDLLDRYVSNSGR